MFYICVLIYPKCIIEVRTIDAQTYPMPSSCQFFAESTGANIKWSLKGSLCQVSPLTTYSPILAANIVGGRTTEGLLLNLRALKLFIPTVFVYFTLHH